MRVELYQSERSPISFFLFSTQSISYIQANGVITKCRHFQVKIYSSKLITDRLQQRCHVTFLIYLFVTSRNLFAWCISVKDNYYNHTKNSRKFQASVTETCTFSISAKSIKSTCGKVKSLKIHCCT